jgi:hypothetical protein
VKDAFMDFMANRETTIIMSDKTQLLIIPATEDNDTSAQPLTPAVIQHATSVTSSPARKQTRTRTALIPIPPTAALNSIKRDRSQTTFYKPQDIRAVTEALRTIMDCKNPPPAIFLIDGNEHPLTDTDIMRSYAIDTLFDSEYYTGDTEGKKRDGRCTQGPRQRLVYYRHTKRGPQPHHRNKDTDTHHARGSRLLRNTTNKRIWKIRTPLKCKRKKKPNGRPDKHKTCAAARGDKLRRSMIKANAPLRVSYSPAIMPLTFVLFLQLAVIQQLHMATMDIKSAYLNASLPQDAD